MLSVQRFAVSATAVVLAAALAIHAPVVEAAKVSECTKIGICYCVNDELKATIAAKVDRFRQVLAEQRKAGKAVGYLSVPLTSAGGGNFDINKEVAESAKVGDREALRRRLPLRAQSGHARRRPAEGHRRRLHADVDDAARRSRRARRFRFRLFRRAAGLRPVLRLRRQRRHGEARGVLRQSGEVQPRLSRRRSKAVSPSRRSAATTRCAPRRR